MKDKKIIESFSSEDTFNIGKSIGENAKKGSVFALLGDMGVGKTVFSKGMAEGLGVKEDIISPTFTILNEYYSGKVPFYHFDVYRIDDIEEMEETGFMDKIYGDGVSLIEWAGKVDSLIPENTINISIEKDLSKGFDYRIIKIDRDNKNR